VDVYSIDEAFLDLTGIDRVVSFEPLVGRRFGSGGITGRLRYNGQRLRLLSIDTPETYKPRCDAELTKGREATAPSANWLPTLSASRLSIPAKPTSTTAALFTC
jgi:nucleotidyltransferase/DNA polymerase involved in DNA repair